MTRHEAWQQGVSAKVKYLGIVANVLLNIGIGANEFDLVSFNGNCFSPWIIIVHRKYRCVGEDLFGGLGQRNRS